MNKTCLTMLTIGLLALSSCNTDIDIGGNFNSYNQTALLNNLGENIILTAYEGLAEETALLQSSTEAFVTAKSEVTLEALKVQLKATRKTWQYCTPYNFGPAADLGLVFNLNIYPIDQLQVETNITSGSYDLTTLANNDTKGFQTLGYLLYGKDKSTADIIASFDLNREKYLTDVVALIDETSQSVFNNWKNSYLAAFTSAGANGVDAGSSVGQLVNTMNRDFERNTRDGKIGIPVGIRSLGTPFPEATEAFFADYSIELLETNIQGYEDLYTGKTGEGLDDFLMSISAVTRTQSSLDEDITTQFSKVKNAISLVNDPLIDAIANQKTQVETIFAEMQGLIILFKTDMASSMGVIITYQDSDGD